MTIENLNKILDSYWAKGWDGYCRFDEGWSDLVGELHNKILNIDPNYKIQQIKEKFGVLRFYYESLLIENQFHNEEIDNIIEDYVKKSREICEICGAKGRPAKLGYRYKTCCEDCMVEYMQEHPSVKCMFVAELIKPIILEKK